jgi:carbonic anhydrase/acetyltransferase-like protein (isoleucine patch superfamily)
MKIHKTANISESTIIKEDVTIKNHVTIEDKCYLEYAKIHPHTYIRSHSFVLDSTIENNSYVSSHSLIAHNSVLPPFSNVYTKYYQGLYITLYYDSYTNNIRYITRLSTNKFSYNSFNSLKEVTDRHNLYFSADNTITVITKILNNKYKLED